MDDLESQLAEMLSRRAGSVPRHGGIGAVIAESQRPKQRTGNSRAALLGLVAACLVVGVGLVGLAGSVPKEKSSSPQTNSSSPLLNGRATGDTDRQSARGLDPLIVQSTPTTVVSALSAATEIKAFACAEGYGAIAKGGRGGDVYHVTKLEDDAKQGSLRHGLESASGPRTIVFDVSGVIHLKSRLKVRSDNLTIAGQTAPGGGVTLAGYPLDIENRSDIVIRYMRFRVGDYNMVASNGQGNGNKDLRGPGGDAIYVDNSDRVILDHISASWSSDEVIDIINSKNVTIQYSIIAEALFDSFHPKGPHSRGLLLLAGVTDEELANGTGGYTLFANLIAHNNMRSPVVGGQMELDAGQSESDRRYMAMDFKNNVIYNWGERSGHTGRANTKMNYVNNYLIAGPNTTAENLTIAMRKEKDDGGGFFLYSDGNVMDIDKDDVHDGFLVGKDAFAGFDANELTDSPVFGFPDISKVETAEQAYQRVLASAGASLLRDATDERVVNNVVDRTGQIIDSQEDVGGLGRALDPGIAVVDSDRDGMPDSWEDANDLDRTDPSDGNGTNRSAAGYTNLEMYLDSIVVEAGHCDVGASVDDPTGTSSRVGGEGTVLDIAISTNDDDAEQKESGQTITRSVDLDLVRSGENQTVGLRFDNVKIPKSSVIVSAHLQFTASGTRSEATDLVLRAVANDAAPPFEREMFEISSAPKTVGSVLWSPEPWTRVGESGPAQRSPDIASVVQEVVSRPGWQAGSPLAITITGTGKRAAVSHDTDPTLAPRLQIVYRDDASTDPPQATSSPSTSTPPTTNVVTDPPSDQHLIFEDGFESGYGKWRPVPAIARLTDTSREGDKALYIEANPNGSQSAFVSAGNGTRYAWNEEYWVGFSLNVPVAPSGYGIVNQHHAVPHIDPATGKADWSCSAGPNSLIIKIVDGQFEIRTSTIASNVDVIPSIGAASWGTKAVTAPFEMNTWHDFVLHFRYAPDDTGFIEVWIDGTKVVNVEKSPTVYNKDLCGLQRAEEQYQRIGVNHGPNDPGGVVIFDSFRVGNSKATYADVVPR